MSIPSETAGAPGTQNPSSSAAVAGDAFGLTPPPGCPAHGGASATVTALYGPEARRDPAETYQQLRAAHGAVAPVELEGGASAWLVLGYRENMEAARTPNRFTRDARIWRDWKEGRIPADSPLVPILGWRPDCTSQDGVEHQRLRSAVNDCVARVDRHGVRRHIQRYANQLIDAFVEQGRADLVAQFAAQLPMLVFTRLFGIAEEEAARLMEASAGLVRGGEKAVEYNDYVINSLITLARDRRANPGHDFASWLVRHEAGLSDEEVVGHLRMVMVAGNETTTSLISSTLRMVLTDPRFRASLVGGLMTLPDAIEQMLWDEPPLMVCPARYATADMQFGGQFVREGDLLLLGLAAGNADPDVRPDPHAPMHGNRSHLAFSRGPHECPGQEIGRAITDTGVDVLLSRLPDLALTIPEGDLTWTSSTWSRHLDTLPVRFAAQRRPAASAAPAAAAAPAEAESAAASTAADTAVPVGRRRGWRGLLARLGGRRG
jgi:cytochrome P450